jgi:hypothetical protein
MTLFFGGNQYGARPPHKTSYTVKATLQLDSSKLVFKVGYLDGEYTGLVCVLKDDFLDRFIPFRSVQSMRNYYTSSIKDGYKRIS